MMSMSKILKRKTFNKVILRNQDHIQEERKMNLRIKSNELKIRIKMKVLRL